MVVKRALVNHIADDGNLKKRLKLEPQDDKSNKKNESLNKNDSNDWAQELFPSLPEEIKTLLNNNEYENIIDEIIKLDHLDRWAYNCLSGIARFNPLIIEDKLPDIFKKILVHKKLTDAEKSSYSELLLAILDACTRLRRETKLVPWILMALDNNLASDYNYRASDILPSTFADKFTLSICNMTHSQVISVLMSFIYHMELIQSQSSLKDKTILIDTASHLLVAFFEGVHILDSNTPENMQKKFINGLIKLGNILKPLVEVAFDDSKSNEIIIESVLNVTKYWKALIASIKKYSDSLTEDLMTSIRQIIDEINKLFDDKDFSGMNKNIIKAAVGCKLEDDKINDTFENDTKYLENLNDCWEILIEKYPFTISRLNESQIDTLACILIANTNFSAKNILLTTPISNYAVQNNKQLIIQCVYNILVDIKKKMSKATGVSKKLLEIITKKKLKSKRIKKF